MNICKIFNVLSIMVVLIICMASCDKKYESSKSTDYNKEIKFPSKELIEQRKKEFIQLWNKLKIKLNNENSFKQLERYLSSNFVYYVGEYIPGKSSLVINIEENNSIEKLTNEINMNDVNKVIQKGEILASVGAETASLYYRKNDNIYPIIDFIYDKNANSWKIDEIRYEVE